MYCKLCGVSCSSDYNYKEHVAGRKHRARVASQQASGGGSSNGPSGGGGIGTCFYFKEGRCWKGAACTYRHVEADGRESKRKFSSTSGSSASSASTPIDTSTSLVTSSSALPPPGCCFAYWQRGSCYKGSSCTYKHIRPGDDVDTTDDTRPASKPAPAPAPSKNTNDLIIEVLLTKGGTTPTKESFPPTKKSNPPTSGTKDSPSADTPTSSAPAIKLAPIFCKPIKSTPTPSKLVATKSPKKPKSKYSFPAKYANAFKGKRNVNLFIQGGLVVWEFAYDLKVMEAIKTHIKGRAWNKSIGVKGAWTCPLESLPEAIALYEHMGRKADSGLKRRAAEIEKAFGGASASDAIKMVIRFSLDEHLADAERQVKSSSTSTTDIQPPQPEPSFGSAQLTFLYDAEVVSALKMLPPSQRSYDPPTKTWTVDILAIPSSLDHLSTIGYTPSKDLQAISNSIEELVGVLYGGSEAEDEEDASATNTAADIEVLVKEELDEDSTASFPPVPGLAPTYSEDSAATSDDNINNAADITSTTTDINESDNHASNLETSLKNVISALAKCSDKAQPRLNSSDYGESKRQRLTSSQESWAMRRMGYDDDEDFGYGYDDFDDDDLFGYSSFFRRDKFATFARKRFDNIKVAKKSKPADCDCGNPRKTIGGVHTCRYFGTFHCRCGNRWTSAYCWKGEKQACRVCNVESLPVKKEPLERRVGKTRRLGHHDTARCEMCRKLGYDCSGY